jgi:hypothetical protein
MLANNSVVFCRRADAYVRHLRQEILLDEPSQHPHEDDAHEVATSRLRVLQQGVFEQVRVEDAQEAAHERDALQMRGLRGGVPAECVLEGAQKIETQHRGTKDLRV